MAAANARRAAARASADRRKLVLITGPTGPVGRYILEHALATDANIRVLALPETLHRLPYRNRVEIIPGALENDAALAAAARGVDVVYHTATISPPPARAPAEMTRVNAGGTRRLLEACAGDIRRFILISTVTVYTPHRTPDTWPVRADAALQAHGNAQLAAWGQSMIDAEDYVTEANQRYGMEYTILRPTVVCGRSAPFAERIIADLLRNPAQVERTNAAWGTMQWIHGVDVARAALLAGDHDGARNQAFIVAGAEPVTSFSLLALLWEIVYSRVEGNPFSEMAAMRRPPLRKFDIGKIRERIGFEPSVSVRQCLEEFLGRYDFYVSASLNLPRQPGLLEPEALESMSPPAGGDSPMTMAGGNRHRIRRA